MKKNAILMAGILSAASILSACNSTANNDDWNQSDNSQKSTNTSTSTASNNQSGKIDLDHLKSRYPNLDLDAVEDYMEQNHIPYDEQKVIAYLDDLEKNGQPTQTSNNTFGSGFPWWLFLLNNNHSGIHSSSGLTTHSNLTHSTTPSQTTSNVSSGTNTNTNTSTSNSISTSSQTTTKSSSVSGSVKKSTSLSKPSTGFGGSHSSGS